MQLKPRKERELIKKQEDYLQPSILTTYQLQPELLPDLPKKNKKLPWVGLTGVMMLIGGAFVFFAMPSMLSCGNKGKQSEAKQYVGAINRSQQAYFLDTNSFSNSIEKLGLGIKTETPNYQYSTSATKTAVYNYAITQPQASEPLRSYVGGVFTVKSSQDRVNTVAVLCESKDKFRDGRKLANPIYQNGSLICGAGTMKVS